MNGSVPIDILQALAARPDRFPEFRRFLNDEPHTQPRDHNERLFASINEAARLCCVSRWTIQRLVKRKRLPIVEIAPGIRRIPYSALTRLAGGI